MGSAIPWKALIPKQKGKGQGVSTLAFFYNVSMGN